jgi:hypothetical protein
MRREVDAKSGTPVEVDMRFPSETTPATSLEPASMGQPVAPPSPIATSANRPDRTQSWWTPVRGVGVGLGAAAVIGIGLGAYFQAAAQSASDDASRLRAGLNATSCAANAPPACSSLRGRIDAVHQDTTASEVGYVVGGVAAVGAAILLIVGESRVKPTTALQVAPATGFAGLNVGAQF